MITIIIIIIVIIIYLAFRCRYTAFYNNNNNNNNNNNQPGRFSCVITYAVFIRNKGSYLPCSAKTSLFTTCMSCKFGSIKA